MPYINERWLGGMLTNFTTISGRVEARCRSTSACRPPATSRPCPRRRRCILTRELEKLQRNLGGIRSMSRLPDAVFVIDTKKEHIAVTEANKLGLPIVAVVDTNCDPDVIDYVIPGNDDAIRSGTLMCRVIADAVDEGRFIAEHRRQMAPPAAPPRRASAPSPRRTPGPARPQAAAGRRQPAGRRGPQPKPASPTPPSRSRWRKRGQVHRQGRRGLRQTTGAGMLDCKKALDETDGDLERAAQMAAREGPRQGGQAQRPREPRGRRGRGARR